MKIKMKMTRNSEDILRVDFSLGILTLRVNYNL
jgi:hypothetical protein